MAQARSSAPLETSPTLPSETNPHHPTVDSPYVLQDTHSDGAVDEPQTYETTCGGTKSSFHGYMYQVKLNALFAIRAKAKGYDRFSVATEIAAAEDFDDVVLQYTNPEENGQLFLQAKHRQDGTKKISYKDLVVVNDGDFSLLKYFIAYRNVKKSCVFKNSHLRNFIICTNIGFDGTVSLELLNGIKLLPVSFEDFFQAPCYKLHVERTSELYRKLMESSDLLTLGTTLAERISKKHRLTFETGVFKRYYKALKDNVFEIKKKGKAYVGVFHQKFIDRDPELTESAKKLHDIILTNLKGKSLSEIEELKLSYSFSEESILSSESFLPEGVSDDDIQEFITKFTLAVKQPNEIELDQKINKELGSQFNIQSVELVANTFQTRILDWAKEKKGIYLTEAFVKEVCDSIENDLCVWTSRGLTLAHLCTIEGCDITFNASSDTQILLDEFLRSDNFDIQILNLVACENIVLSSIIVYQKLKDFDSFKARDSYMFVSLKMLCEPRRQRSVTNAFRSIESYNLLVIECGSLDSRDNTQIQTLCDELIEVLRRNGKKRLILITGMGENEALHDKFESDNDNNWYIKEDEKSSFKDLSETSQTMLLEKKVLLQGKSVSLRELADNIDEEFIKVIDAETLVKLIKDISITIGNDPLRMHDLEPAYAHVNEDIAPGSLVDALLRSSEEASLFFITGVDQTGRRILEDELTRKITGEDDAIDLRKSINSDQVAEEDFKEICRKNSYHRWIYWIIWENNKFIWKQTYDPKFYIARKFIYRDKIVINAAIRYLPNECVVYSSVSDTLLMLFDFDHDQVDILNTVCVVQPSEQEAEKDFKQLLRERSEPLHWLKAEDNKFVWQRSNGSLNGLIGFVDEHNEEPLDEKTFCKNFKEKTVVIIDEPGMGKTTTLTKLSDYISNTNVWVVRRNLRDCDTAIKSLPVRYQHFKPETVVNFLLETENTASRNMMLTNKLMHYKLANQTKQWPLLFLFDGFDEVKAENGKVKVSLFLRFLKDRASVWVTARKQETQLLQNSLSVFSTHFEEIEAQKKEFLRKYWMARMSLTFSKAQLNEIGFDVDNNHMKIASNDRSVMEDTVLGKELQAPQTPTKFDVYSGDVLKKATSIFGAANTSRFIGTPLQLHLLAEYFLEGFKEFLKSNASHHEIKNFEILDLYIYFINAKYSIYFHEKTGLTYGFTEVSKGWFLETLDEKHSELALMEVFGDKVTELPGEKFPFLYGDCKSKRECARKELGELLRVGLIQSAAALHEYEFIHRTFAEFFVSAFFANALQKKTSNPTIYEHARKFLLTCVFKENSAVIFMFLEALAKREQESNLNAKWVSLKECSLFRNETATRQVTYTKKKQQQNPSRQSLMKDFDLARDWTEEDLTLAIFAETRIEQLKSMLKHFVNVFYAQFHRFEFSNITAVIMHYVVQATHQSKLDDTFLDNLIGDGPGKEIIQTLTSIGDSREHKEQTVKELIELLHDDNHILLPLRINLSDCRSVVADIKDDISQIFCERYESMCASHSRSLLDGLDIAKTLLLLTTDMSDAFISTLFGFERGSNKTYGVVRVFVELVCPILELMQFEQVLANVDKSGFLAMFHSFADCLADNDHILFNQVHLQGLLYCIENVLQGTIISAANLSSAVQALISLGKWNLNVIDVNDTILVQDPSAEFEYEFSSLKSKCKTEVVKLINWKVGNPEGDFESECESAAERINKFLSCWSK